MTLRIAIVEDDSRYLDSLETFFKHAEGFSLADKFVSAESALRAAERGAGAVPWDLVLMDLELPRMDGIEATRRLKQLHSRMPVVILTAFEDAKAILEAICAGADGYLLKKISARELRMQLRAIVEGGSPLTAGVARTVLQLLRESEAPAVAQARDERPKRLDLTGREQDVLRCLVRGMSYQQAADSLGLSLDTVRSHIRSVYGKLQVHSVAEAVSRAIRERLV